MVVPICIWTNNIRTMTNLHRFGFAGVNVVQHNSLFYLYFNIVSGARIGMVFAHAIWYRNFSWKKCVIVPCFLYCNLTSSLVWCYKFSVCITLRVKINAPHTHIAVLLFISNIPPKISSRQNCYDTLMFCTATIFVNYYYANGRSCYNSWANKRCSCCSPLGKYHCKTGLLILSFVMGLYIS